MTDPRSHLNSGDLGLGDDRISPLVAAFVDRLNAGERIDPMEVIANHPVDGEQILERLEAFVAVAARNDNESPGTLGDYTLRRQIGRGGMGVVYEAWENSMDRAVALKVLPAGVAADDRAFQRFMQEAKTAGKLSHPNVVPVFFTGMKEQTPFYAMELVKGETLAQILARIRDAEPDAETPFGNKDDGRYFMNLADALADVADGLQHAHSKGVTHRDIKPSNLILDGDGRLRILDFGLARLEGQESLTFSGDLVGTPLYMSPEQAQRMKIPVDHRTDVYSLGATMYEGICGRPPFQGRDHAATLSQIIERDPVAPQKINPRVPKDLETIMLKCLRKDAVDRYGTAEALGQDLRRFVRGEVIEARPRSAWDRAARRVWKHRAVAVATSVVLAFVVMVLAVSNAFVARARDQARFDLYVSNMRLAVEDWRTGNYARFTEILERHGSTAGDSDLRGWEWYYLYGLTGKELISFESQNGVAQDVAWSPGGDRLALGGTSGVIRIRNTTSGETTHEIDCGERIGQIIWTAEGSLIAVPYGGKRIQVWDADTGKSVDTLQHGSSIRAFSRSAAGTVASMGWSDREVRIWSESTWEQLATIGDDGSLPRIGEEAGVSGLGLSPDAKLLVTASGGAVGRHPVPYKLTIWDTESREPRHTVPMDSRASAMAWSLDGRRLAFANAKQEVLVWNRESHDVEVTLRGHSGKVHALSWNRLGELASAAGDSTVRIWNPEKGEARVTLRGHRGAVNSNAWSSDGRYLASASLDGTVKIWEPDPDDESIIRAGRDAAAWSMDGRYVATIGHEAAVTVYNALTFEEIATFGRGSTAATSIDFSPDSLFLAAAGEDGIVKIWKVPSGDSVLTIEAGPVKAYQARWSPDGQLLATGTRRSLKIWDALSGRERVNLRGHRGYVRNVAWSPNGDLLASMATDDRWIIVWDTRRWEEARKIPLSPSEVLPGPGNRLIVWSPSGERLAVADVEGQVHVFDPLSGNREMSLGGHSSEVRAVTWSPDGTRIATGGNDRTIKVWHALTGDELVTLYGHKGQVRDVSWSGDGWRLASGGQFSLRIWDATAGYELLKDESPRGSSMRK